MGTKFTSLTTSKKRSKQSKKRWTPHPYQKRGVKLIVSKPHVALFLDPGLGKTAITLAAYKVLKSKGYAKGMLVVAPLRVAHSVWPAEVEEWADFKGLRVTVLHGPEKDERAAEDHDVYVVNYEGLPWLLKGPMDDMLKERRVDMLVFDELSKMKSSSTKRFKLLKPWLHKFRRRVGLTGSPASNGLMDLFGQIYVLDRGERLGEYITHYRNRFFVPDGPFDWRLQEGAAKRIQDAIKDMSVHMSAEDYLTLPPQVDNIVRVTLPPKARTMYEEMEDLLIAQIGEGTVVAATAAAALSKCKQICNGAVYNNPVDPVTGAPTRGSEYAEVHDAKITALLDILDEQQGQPTLIAYEFKHDLKRLLAALPKGTPHIGGGTSAKEAARLEALWNRDALPILLGHPASIGHGLNLQKGSARTIIWFSTTWDFELYDQFNRRLRRQGSTADRIVVHHIVAEDTVDESVMRALRNKDRTQKSLLLALKERRR